MHAVAEHSYALQSWRTIAGVMPAFEFHILVEMPHI